MCGIVGSINTNWINDPLNSLAHRGPDYQDFINIKDFDSTLNFESIVVYIKDAHL
jgi:asparagine synthetase B (glutamine-hydrolysing)